ncbi:MAG TPA: hypothetical protein VGU45_16015 [Microvirga sp.]|jgi:hypothetical protein|nr:hypothetical protein [Microvirga sp.]
MRRIGVPWYTRESYPRIRAMMNDDGTLAPTYDAWRMAAENNEGEARRVGIEVVRVPLEPEVFAAWCEEQGRPLDRAGRVAFVEEALRDRPQGEAQSGNAA